MKRTTPLLVIGAALLAVDIDMRVSPGEAAGQEPESTVEPPHVVRIVEIAGASAGALRFLWRRWSDGVIEENRRSLLGADPQWQGWVVVPEVPVGEAVQEPAPSVPDTHLSSAAQNSLIVEGMKKANQPAASDSHPVPTPPFPDAGEPIERSGLPYTPPQPSRRFGG